MIWLSREKNKKTRENKKNKKLSKKNNIPGLLEVKNAKIKKNSTTKKPKIQNFMEKFWFQVKRCYFLVFLEFFVFLV